MHEVAVIGAGPVGMAAAVRLMMMGINPIVYETGSSVGSAIRDWGHVRLFTDWESVLDPVAVEMLASTGWSHPPGGSFPTGNELVADYLEPLGDLLSEKIRFNHTVVGVSRGRRDKTVTQGRSRQPFVLRVESPSGTTDDESRWVVDASGTWTTPNPLGSNGMRAFGEGDATRIRYGLPDVLSRDRNRYVGRRVAVVGAGHSAANVLLDLADLALEEPDTQAVWVIRAADPTRAYGVMEDDELPERGKVGFELSHRVDEGRIELVADFGVNRVVSTDTGIELVGLDSAGDKKSVSAQEVVVATGQRPNLEMTRELRLDLDPSLESPRQLAPLIDPNDHSCLTVPIHGVSQLSHPEDGYWTVGIKSYGRAPTFLMMTGYRQVESVVEHIATEF